MASAVVNKRLIVQLDGNSHIVGLFFERSTWIAQPTNLQDRLNREAKRTLIDLQYQIFAALRSTSLRKSSFREEGAEVLGFGRVDPDDVRRALQPGTLLISVMHANNEVGTIQPIEEIARIAKEAGVLMHSDAAQSLGKIAFTVRGLGVDLLSIAGHKLYAPKGVGALYIREGVSIEPLIPGTNHESGRRAGTENVLLDMALWEACDLARTWSGSDSIRSVRDLFWDLWQQKFGDRVVLNGHPTERLPNTLNVSFVGQAGADIWGAWPEWPRLLVSVPCRIGGVVPSPTGYGGFA